MGEELVGPAGGGQGASDSEKELGAPGPGNAEGRMQHSACDEGGRPACERETEGRERLGGKERMCKEGEIRGGVLKGAPDLLLISHVPPSPCSAPASFFGTPYAVAFTPRPGPFLRKGKATTGENAQGRGRSHSQVLPFCAAGTSRRTPHGRWEN